MKLSAIFKLRLALLVPITTSHAYFAHPAGRRRDSVLALFSGGGAGSLLLEQRVHHVADDGERHCHPAHHVPGAVQKLKVTLE